MRQLRTTDRVVFSYSFIAAFEVIHRSSGFTDNSSTTDPNRCLLDYSSIRVKFVLLPSLKALFLNTLGTWNTICGKEGKNSKFVTSAWFSTV